MLNYVMQLGRVAFILQKRRKSMGTTKQIIGGVIKSVVFRSRQKMLQVKFSIIKLVEIIVKQSDTYYFSKCVKSLFLNHGVYSKHVCRQTPRTSLDPYFTVSTNLKLFFHHLCSVSTSSLLLKDSLKPPEHKPSSPINIL